MTAPRIGSLCTGYGGLDSAVRQVFGGETVWHADIDPGASAILAHHWPHVPNLGDLTATDWHQVVDTFGRPHIVTGGYPCQPFSDAGLRKGTEDERHIWPHIANALRVLRPRIVVLENVRGHLGRGFDTVLADLARLGFDAQWCLASASEVGAPHRRTRLFVLAVATDTANIGHERSGRTWDGRSGLADGRLAAADAERLGREGQRGDTGAQPEWSASATVGCGPAGGRAVAADADGRGREGHAQRHGDALEGQPEDQSRLDSHGPSVCREAAADSEGFGRGEGRTEPARQQGRPGAPGSGAPDWGSYGPAIRRWEAVTGRTAPWATDVRGRLSPRFVEWMQGLAPGHVTDVPGLTRTAQLKALGNGVVPAQAAAAIRLLHARAFPATQLAEEAA